MDMSDPDIRQAAIGGGGTAAGLTVYGITLNDYVAIATLIWVVIQIIILWPKFINQVGEWRVNVVTWYKAFRK